MALVVLARSDAPAAFHPPTTLHQPLLSAAWFLVCIPPIGPRPLKAPSSYLVLAQVKQRKIEERMHYRLMASRASKSQHRHLSTSSRHTSARCAYRSTASPDFRALSVSGPCMAGEISRADDPSPRVPIGLVIRSPPHTENLELAHEMHGYGMTWVCRMRIIALLLHKSAAPHRLTCNFFCAFWRLVSRQGISSHSSVTVSST